MKQLPPNPGPECRNLDPILLSNPIALETSLTSAPVASHIAPIEFMELILWARNAFAVNLANSLLQIFVWRILFLGILFVSGLAFSFLLAEQKYFNDFQLRSNFQKGLEELLDYNQSVSLVELKKQLNQKH